MLDWSIRLFRVCGIRLELHLSFFLLPAYFGNQGWKYAGLTGLFWSLVFLAAAFACVTLHELGHALAARRCGIRTSRILLMPIGGLAQIESQPRGPKEELFITICGPLVNFALFALLRPFAGPFSLEAMTRLPLNFEQLIQAAMSFNLIMGLFNLLPIFPMDGGRLLRAGLSFWKTPLRATAIAAKLGGFLAAALAVYLLMEQELLPAALFVFIFFAGQMEHKALAQAEVYGGLRARDFVDAQFPRLPPEATVGDALSLIERYGPGDIAIVEDQRVIAFANLAALDKALEGKRRLPPDAPLIGIATRKFATLQAEDELVAVAQTVEKLTQTRFPVYQYSTLIGILDTRDLERRAYWTKATRRNG